MTAFDEKTDWAEQHPRAVLSMDTVLGLSLTSGPDLLPLKNGAARAMLGAMEKLSPTVKFVAAIVLATAAFGGLFWLLFGQGAT